MNISVKQKKKKVDYAALESPFMRIPRMDIVAARHLLDLGFRQTYELQGRSAEALFDELKKRVESPPKRTLYAFRLAIYYAETPQPDRSLLCLEAWTD